MYVEAGQDLKAQLGEVYPLVRGILCGSVIEIEAIDVYVRPGCLNGKMAPKKAKPPDGGSRPRSED
jgi:hypothetical protein